MFNNHRNNLLFLNLILYFKSITSKKHLKSSICTRQKNQYNKNDILIFFTSKEN